MKVVTEEALEFEKPKRTREGLKAKTHSRTKRYLGVVTCVCGARGYLYQPLRRYIRLNRYLLVEHRESGRDKNGRRWTKTLRVCWLGRVE
jgi:hypothetical protein